jgi:N-acetylmuramic acid 6-phosphate etherase
LEHIKMSSTDKFLIETLANLTTEQRAPELADIDALPLSERCILQNRLDHEVADAVGREIDSITRAVESIVAAFRSGGRLIYVGAGTSGRLGVLDASECPPTFGTAPSLVQAVIAGGGTALTTAIEGIEDDYDAGGAAMDDKKITSSDCVVGISASGRTPFVLGALDRARKLGASTVGVTNNRPSDIEASAGETIAVIVGPEFIAGSTRLKAGTAQKLVLNMLTTQSMIEMGKTFGNAMVDVMVTNAKLAARARRLVREITGASDEQARATLESAGGSAKIAILMVSNSVDAVAARTQLQQAEGNLRQAIMHRGEIPSERR